MVLPTVRQWWQQLLGVYKTHQVDVFVFTVVTAYTALFIELIMFHGFLEKFGFDLFSLLALAICLGLVAWRHPAAGTHVQLQLLQQLHMLLAVAQLFVCVLLAGLVVMGMGIFSQGQINVTLFATFTLFTWILLALPMIAKATQCSTRQLIVIGLFIYVLFSQVYGFSDLLLSRIHRAKMLLPMNSLQRVTTLWHVVPFFEFVKVNTPSDAKIMHPPQLNPWPETGNQFVVRRFLYPRLLIAPEWGQGDYDWVMVDDGQPYLGNAVAQAGWPISIIPSQRTIFLRPWEKKMVLSNLEVGDQHLDLQVTLPETDQPLKVISDENWVELQASISAVQTVFVPLAPTQLLTPKQTVTLEVKTTEDYVTRLAVEFMTPNGQTEYLYSPLNRNAPQSDTLVIPDAYQQIQLYYQLQGWVSPTQVPVTIGLDVGAPRPMAYLHGKGLIHVDKTAPTSDDIKNCTERQCLNVVEHLFLDGKFESAHQVLQRIKPLHQHDPYFNYMQYLVAKELQHDNAELKSFLIKAKQYWSHEAKYNIPQSLLENKPLVETKD